MFASGTPDVKMKKAQGFGAVAGGNETELTFRDGVRGHHPVENKFLRDALHDFASDGGESNGSITVDEIFRFAIFPDWQYKGSFQLLETSPEFKLLFRREKNCSLLEALNAL